MNVLADTSVWSLALRREGRAGVSQAPEAAELRRLIAAGMAVIIGPVRQELLSGVRDSGQFRRLQSHLSAFPDVTLTTEDYVLAAQFCNLCRSKGIQGSNTDFLICAAAVRRDVAVFTTDADFPRFAACVPITLHGVSKSSQKGAGHED